MNSAWSVFVNRTLSICRDHFGKCASPAETAFPALFTLPLQAARVIVVRVFIKKTQKTPVAEIELALQRAKEVQK